MTRPRRGTDAPGPAAPDLDPFAEGRSLVQADLNGTVLNVWVYKPGNYVGDGFVLLLHGASRAAEAYRDNAPGLRGPVWADGGGARVRRRALPQNMGGVFREDGSFADEEERGREGTAELPWIVLGYSAGARFLERLSAFMDLDAERLVIMSPGSAMFPTRDMEYGLGFGGVPEELSSDDRLRRYLALPITIANGTADREMGQLPTGDAYDQGVHRYSRNLRWFNTAMDLAFEKGGDFNWRLVIAHGAGHPPPEMFNHPELGNALFGHRLWRWRSIGGTERRKSQSASISVSVICSA